jgi:hypothetical protein
MAIAELNEMRHIWSLVSAHIRRAAGVCFGVNGISNLVLDRIFHELLACWLVPRLGLSHHLLYVLCCYLHGEYRPAVAVLNCNNLSPILADVLA